MLRLIIYWLHAVNESCIYNLKHILQINRYEKNNCLVLHIRCETSHSSFFVKPFSVLIQLNTLIC